MLTMLHIHMLPLRQVTTYNKLGKPEGSAQDLELLNFHGASPESPQNFQKGVIFFLNIFVSAAPQITSYNDPN